MNSVRSLYEVQILLNHRDPKTTMRYSHLSSKSLQEAANTASTKLLEAMPVEEASEVVPGGAQQVA